MFYMINLWLFYTIFSSIELYFLIFEFIIIFFFSGLDTNTNKDENTYSNGTYSQFSLICLFSRIDFKYILVYYK